MDQIANNPSLAALHQVMQQQSQGNAGVLQQNNPAQSVPQLPQAQGGGMPVPQAPQGMSAAQTAPTGQGLPSGSPEAQIILKAIEGNQKILGTRLAKLSERGE